MRAPTPETPLINWRVRKAGYLVMSAVACATSAAASVAGDWMLVGLFGAMACAVGYLGWTEAP